MIQSLISVLDTLGEAALLTDAELSLVALNPLAESLYQVSPKAVIGQNLVVLIGTVISSTREEGWAAILRGDTWRGVIWHQRPNRSRFRAEISVRAIFDQANTFVGTLAIVKDVTMREAEAIRQNILGRCLRAMSDAKTVTELYNSILEALTGENAADCTIFRTREADGYHLLAAHGVATALLEPIRVADFVAEEPAFLRAETLEVVFANPQTPEKYQLVQGLGFRQAHLVGQRVAGELVGSLALLYRQVPWVDLRPILPEIAATLGARLERERTQAKLERERVALSALAQVTTTLRQAEHAGDAYRIATEFALQATHASSSFVLLANPERDQMQPVGGSGVNAEPMLQLSLPRGKGLSWQVLDSGQPLVVEISEQTTQAFRLRENAQGMYIGVPVFDHNQQQKQVVGVLTADTQANGVSFSFADLDVLTAIAEALTGTLGRIEALETAKNRAAAFATLAQLSSDLEQRGFLQQVF
jgi:PAS domain/GAF domain